MSLPPVEPPDLRNRRSSSNYDDDDDNYPPRDYSPPPRRNNAPPPQRQQGSYPPPEDYSYPPPEEYPPRESRPARYAEDLDEVQAPDLRRNLRDTRSYPTDEREDYTSPPRDTRRATSSMRSVNIDEDRRDRYSENLDDREAPDLRRRERGGRKDTRSRYEEDLPERRDTPVRRSSGPTSYLQEHQIEALAAGLTLLMIGMGIIVGVVTGNYTFLIKIFPLLGGSILLGGALFQRLIMGWQVNIASWGFAALFLAIGITEIFNREEVLNRSANVVTGSVFFCGTFVMMAGIVIVLQVFRSG